MTSSTHGECVPTSKTTRAAFNALKEFGNVLLLRTQLSSVSVSPSRPRCSIGSIGPPSPLLPSDDRDSGEAHLADALLRPSLLPPFSDPAFPSVFPPVPLALSSYPVASGPTSSAASMSVHSSFRELLCS